MPADNTLLQQWGATAEAAVEGIPAAMTISDGCDEKWMECCWPGVGTRGGPSV